MHSVLWTLFQLNLYFLVLSHCHRMTVFNGGAIKSTSELPFISYITIRIFGCTGSLIGPAKVLTAGHCLCEKGLKPSEVQVQLGLTDARRPTAAYPVDDFRMEPKYRKQCRISLEGANAPHKVSGFDVGILSLGDEPRLTKNVALAKVNFVNPVRTGTKLLVAGYGLDLSIRNSYKNPNMGILKTGQLKASKCPYKKGESKKFRYPICVERGETKNKQISGGGDSGGPLLLDNKDRELVGITSGIIKLRMDGKVKTFNIFSRLQKNQKFIEFDF